MSISNSSVTQVFSKTANTRRVGGVNKAQILPAGQAQGSVFMPTIRTLNATYPPTLFNSAQKVSSLLPKIDFIKHLLMKATITVTGSPVTLVPANYWFRQIDLRDSGSGRIIQTVYDDAAHANLLNRLSAGRERSIFETSNMEFADVGKYGLTRPLAPGVHTFMIPMLTSVFENFGGLYLADMVGDLMIDLTTPSTIIASGAGSISCNMEFMVEGATLSDQDQKIYRDRYKMHATECHFLQPIRTEFYNKTLTAGSSNNLLPINNVDGLCAYQMLMVRPTGTIGNNADFASWRLLDLGDAAGAAIDLVSSSGASIWGNGSPVPCQHIRQHQSVDQFDNAWVSEKPVYFLNYSDSMNAALAGRINGAYRFDSSAGDQIRLTLPSAPVAEVQTVTFSAAPSATGFYSFSYKGEQSAQIVGNSSVAVMKATLEAMRGLAAKNVTVVCSAVASAGTSFTITITDPQDEFIGELIQVNMHGGMTCSSSTARTVAGVAGLASGAYDVVVYSYVFNVAGYSNGKLSSQLLLA